jgi:hypothetical protein
MSKDLYKLSTPSDITDAYDETLHAIPFFLNWKDAARNWGVLVSYEPNSMTITPWTSTSKHSSAGGKKNVQTPNFRAKSILTDSIGSHHVHIIMYTIILRFGKLSWPNTQRSEIMKLKVCTWKSGGMA